MRIEKISDNKIKVMLDNKEAMHWNINFKSISKNSPAVQEMFWTAIKLAEENVDFYINGAKLFIEAVQDNSSEEYGFGMIITKVCNQNELTNAIESCGYKGKLRRSTLNPTLQSVGLIYRFKDFDSLCLGINEIIHTYSGISKVYKYKSEFYLYLIPEKGVSISSINVSISEFGFKVQDSQYIHGMLNEYGELMIEKDAIEVMEKYFCVK